MRRTYSTYPALAVAIVVLVAVFCSVQNILLGANHFWSDNEPYTYYNNFVIFRQSFINLINHENLYIQHRPVYADLFKYSPAFALLMAPFSLLPVETGLVAWNLAGCLLLFAGLKSLVQNPGHLLLLTALLIPETITSVANSQSNTHIAGLLLLAFASLENGKVPKAALYLLLTVFIKIFTLVLLPIFLFYPNKLRSALWLLGWLLLLTFIPALVVGFDSLLQQYQNWALMLKYDHSTSSGLGIVGLIEAFSGFQPNRTAVMGAGLLMLVAPLARVSCYGQQRFRTTYFVMVLIWMVLFNHKAESPTFVLVMVGVLLFAHSMQYKGVALFFLYACMVFTSLAVSDLVPYSIRKTYVGPYCIKAIFPALLMFYMFFRLMVWPAGREGAGLSAEQLPGVLQG